MYNAHKITDKVAAGKLAIGSHVGFDSPFVTEMIAGCGFDFIWIDGEHSAIDRKDIQNHLMACRAAGISAQDAVFSDINDKEGLQRDLEMTRTLGFDGKTCVHPRQIDAVNACFTPSAKEIRNAERVLAALDEAAKNHTGVCTLDGSMVDKPMELRARTTLAKAAAAGIKIGGVQA